jgi:prophage regulatory protein
VTAQQRASQKAAELKKEADLKKQSRGGEQVTTSWKGLQTLAGSPTIVIRRRALLELLGVSNTTLYAWIAAGTFPPPISIGKNSVAWLADEVAAFIEQRRKERDRQLQLEDAG